MNGSQGFDGDGGITVVGGRSSGKSSDLSSVGAGAAAGSAFGPWGAVIGGGLGLVGSLFESSSAKREAEKTRRWSEELANTAHQREVGDLRAAGLNPILSATGGAGAATPSGPMAVTPDFAGAIERGVSTGSQAERVSKAFSVEMDNMKADTKLKGDTGMAQRQQAASSANQAQFVEQQRKNAKVEEQILKEELTAAQASAAKARNVQSVEEGPLGNILKYVEAISRAFNTGLGTPSWRRR